MKQLAPLIIATTLLASACGVSFTDPSREFSDAPVAPDTTHPVVIHSPTTLGVVDSHLMDVNGTPIGVSCDTCHGPNPDQAFVASVPEGQKMHEGVDLKHGALDCDYCHVKDDRTKLHLADGTKVDFDDTMTLCAQCHGVQFRDYNRGSHGGMNGYWDLKRGPRYRNHCVDCHAPHTPAYEPVRPVHPPRDRFLESAKEAH